LSGLLAQKVLIAYVSGANALLDLEVHVTVTSVSDACELRSPSSVKPVLLYGYGTWKCTKKIAQSLQAFINRCLRRIFKIFWPETNSNEHLWQMAKEKPIIQQIKDRKWQWTGNIQKR
jgi:hypothetical protein